jgi:hypothetical protein
MNIGMDGWMMDGWNDGWMGGWIDRRTRHSVGLSVNQSNQINEFI